MEGTVSETHGQYYNYCVLFIFNFFSLGCNQEFYLSVITISYTCNSESSFFGIDINSIFKQ